MKLLKLIIALAAMTSFIACDQKPKKEPPIDNKESTKTDKPIESKKPAESLEGWKTLEENNYSISYPANWAVNKSGQMGSSFILISPPSSVKDKFRENVNLLIQDMAGVSFDLDKYVEISESQIETLVTDGIIIESKRMRGQTSDYHKIIYSGTQGIYQLKFEQYYWVIKETAYVLTFTGDEAEFENNLVTAEKILNSFKFIDS